MLTQSPSDEPHGLRWLAASGKVSLNTHLHFENVVVPTARHTDLMMYRLQTAGSPVTARLWSPFIQAAIMVMITPTPSVIQSDSARSFYHKSICILLFMPDPCFPMPSRTHLGCPGCARVLVLACMGSPCTPCTQGPMCRHAHMEHYSAHVSVGPCHIQGA